MPLHPSEDDLADAADTQRHTKPTTFRERHALAILGVIMAAMFAVVIVAQVAC